MLKKSLLSERNQMQNAMYMLPFIWHSRTLNTIAAENRSVVVISHIWRKDIDWKRQGNFCGDWLFWWYLYNCEYLSTFIVSKLYPNKLFKIIKVNIRKTRNLWICYRFFSESKNHLNKYARSSSLSIKV